MERKLSLDEDYKKLAKSKIDLFTDLLKIPGSSQYFDKELIDLNEKFKQNNFINKITLMCSPYITFFVERRYTMNNIVYGMTRVQSLMKTITLFVAIPLYICSLHYNFFVLDHIKNLEKALNRIDFEDKKFKLLYFDHFSKVKEDGKTPEK